MKTGINQRCAAGLALAASFLFACAPARKPAGAPVSASVPAFTAPPRDALLDSLLLTRPQWFDTLMRHQEQWGIQIVYTKIDRQATGAPRLEHHVLGDPKQYFYPASTVKLPTLLMALQRLESIPEPRPDIHTTMITEAEGPRQEALYNEPQAADGRPTMERYIQKILLVSDNDAFNRLYEFTGQQYLNRGLQAMGYDSVQIIHRLSVSLPEAANRATNPVSFYSAAGQIVYRKPAEVSALPYAQRHDTLGSGFMRGGKLVNAPFDFSKRNRLPLRDLHDMMIALVMPEAVTAAKRFRISEDSRRTVLHWASRWPREATLAGYDSAHHPDTYCKFLMYGGGRAAPKPGIRIFNKVGNAYGFLVDAAYIADFDNGVEFFLSAVIACNSDGIFNDDKYEYDSVGLPFMQHLGELIHDYELKRPRSIRPDLSSLPH